MQLFSFMMILLQSISSLFGFGLITFVPFALGLWWSDRTPYNTTSDLWAATVVILAATGVGTAIGLLMFLV